MSLIKYTIEYPIQTSISILYKRLSTASGLSEWFADNVNIRNEVFTFFWEETEQEAKLVKKKEEEYIRYQWIEDEDLDIYFEFKIQIDEMTKDISLIITDFAENDEQEEEKLLWDAQIESLKRAIGI